MSASVAGFAMPPDFQRKVRAVVIGASAGGVEALLAVLPGLPADYPLPVIVVLHQSEEPSTLLSDLFAKRTHLAVRQAADKEPLAAGTLYFGPPGYHLLLQKDGSLSLSCDAPLNFSRPSIDVLFESAADALGAGLAGVLLSGANEDGAAGLACIGRLGGLTLVQEPQQASSPAMPLAAIARRTPDFVLPLPGILALLNRLQAL